MLTLNLIGACAAAALIACACACSDDYARRSAVARAGGDACLVPQSQAGKYGYVNAQGQWMIPPRFDGADTFSDGLALVLQAGRFGYIDSAGVMAIPAVFRHARPFHGGFALVRREDRWLLIDHGGRAYPWPASAGTQPVAAADP